MDQVSIKYTHIFHCKIPQNLPKFGLLVWKQTIWQPRATCCSIARTWKLNLPTLSPEKNLIGFWDQFGSTRLLSRLFRCYWIQELCPQLSDDFFVQWHFGGKKERRKVSLKTFRWLLKSILWILFGKNLRTKPSLVKFKIVIVTSWTLKIIKPTITYCP
jgi:hypothetical protein